MKLNFRNREEIKALQCETNAPNWKTSIHDFIKFYLESDEDLIQKTSGSTGTPKEISLSRKTLEASAEATIDFFDIPKNAKALLCIPAKYIGGKMMIARSFLGEWELTCIKPELHLELGEEEFDFAAMIPAQVQLLLNSNPEQLLRIKTLIIGGAPVSLELEKQLCNAKINAYSTYGMTETASHVALKRLDEASHFRGLKGVTFSIHPDTGCLVISGSRIPSSPLRTNDVVELISETEFIWRGRADHVINSGGMKILVEELETAIKPHLSFSFYIKKAPHFLLGESPILVLESQALLEKEKQEILNGLKSKLPKNWCPTEVHCNAEFTYTESGKLLRI